MEITQVQDHLTANVGDSLPIAGIKNFSRQFCKESLTLWYLAGPAVFTSVCQYSLGAVTQLLVGQLGTGELAAVAVENSVIAAFSFGAMLGMGSALETLCGQAYGAGELKMLGIYMQRSWVILITTSLLISQLYIFAHPLLKLVGQTEEVSKSAGGFALWMIPQLFAYAMNFPIAKFLQAQNRIMAMAIISVAVLLLHVLFSWLFIFKLGWGLVGAAVVLNGSWWLIVVAQLIYIFSGTCGEAWSGFSWKAFQNLWGFARLSLASAVMLCLELWYYRALILFAGCLKNAKISVDALAICMNIWGWAIMVTIGMNAAISVRVSNELGASHPRKAKFAVVVASLSSFFIGLLVSATLIIERNNYPTLFSRNAEVDHMVKELMPILAFCIVIGNIQPVLTGVAIGAGWQRFVAYVNIACYYLFGLPLGLTMGYKFHMGVKGVWCGMLAGTGLQTWVLFIMVYRTNWSTEASFAGDRVKKWRGDPGTQTIDNEKNTEA